MKILCICSHLRAGGAQRQWSILVPALRRHGFEPFLGALEEEGELFGEVVAGGVPAGCARMKRRTDLFGARRALAWSRLRPDVVLSHGVRAQVFAEVIASRVGSAHVTADHRAPGFPFKPHRELLLRIVAPRIDRVVAVTERQIPQLLRRRYRPDAIRVIRNGVDASLLRPNQSRAEARKELRLDDDDFAALFLSVLRPEKRAPAFVRAVVSAAAREPRIRGLVAGFGPDEPEVERLANAAGDTVSLLGYRADVANLIVAADAVCLTSAAEAAPMSALEAMCLERAVVATDVGAIGEVVVHRETGLLVPAGDDEAFATGLVELARDNGLVRRLGRAGAVRQRELFRADEMVSAYAALFRELVPQARRGRSVGVRTTEATRSSALKRR